MVTGDGLQSCYVPALQTLPRPSNGLRQSINTHIIMMMKKKTETDAIVISQVHRLCVEWRGNNGDIGWRRRTTTSTAVPWQRRKNTTSIDDDYAKGKCDKELNDTKGIGVHLRIRSLFRDASNDYCEKGDQCRRSRRFEHGEAEFVFIWINSSRLNYVCVDMNPFEGCNKMIENNW